MEQIVYKNIRIQLLSEDVVRIERAGKDGFCDENTFFIPSRLQYEKARIEYSREENVICFSEYKLYLPEEGKCLAGVKLEKNGKRVYTYRKQPNSGELPPLDKTSEVFAVFDCPRILVPEGGYSADRKGEYIVEENAQDVYLLLCGKDFKKLRRLYVELTGRCEFVRLSRLGGGRVSTTPIPRRRQNSSFSTMKSTIFHSTTWSSTPTGAIARRVGGTM